MMPKATSSTRITLHQLVARKRQKPQTHGSHAVSPSPLDQRAAARAQTPKAVASYVPMIPKPKLPADIAIDMLRRHDMQGALHQQMVNMVLAVPTHRQIAFARQVIVLCAQSRIPQNPVKLDLVVMQALCDLDNATREFVIDQSAALVQPTDHRKDRLLLVDTLARHHDRLTIILKPLVAFLGRIPTTLDRVAVIELFGQTQNFSASKAETVLRLAEPFLPHFDAGTLQVLRESLAHIHPNQAAKKRQRSQIDEDVNPVRLPDADRLDTLSDEQIEAILGNEECACDEQNYNINPMAQGNQVTITLDRENVMNSRRHIAAIAAIQVLTESAPLPLATDCIWPHVELMVYNLHQDKSFRTFYGFNHEESEDLLYVWDGQKGVNDLSAALRRDAYITYLRGHAMGSLRLVSQLYWAVQCYHRPGETWVESTQTRALMRTSLFRAMAQTYEPEMFEGTPAQRKASKRRVCQVGLCQRLLTALAGYYPYSIDSIGPQTLLSHLAQTAFGDLAETETPELVRLVSFMEHAQLRAREVFGSENTEELALFDSHLFDYLSYTFDFTLLDLPSSAQSA